MQMLQKLFEQRCWGNADMYLSKRENTYPNKLDKNW